MEKNMSGILTASTTATITSTTPAIVRADYNAPFDWFDWYKFQEEKIKEPATRGPIEPGYGEVFRRSVFQFTPKIEKIYVSRKKNTVAVKWKDGKVTKVKLQDGDNFDLETGVAMAMLKRVTISHHHLQKSIEKLVEYTDRD